MYFLSFRVFAYNYFLRIIESNSSKNYHRILTLLSCNFKHYWRSRNAVYYLESVTIRWSSLDIKVEYRDIKPYNTDISFSYLRDSNLTP